MSLDTAAVILTQAVLFYAVGWVVADFFLNALARSGRGLRASIGLPERLLAAVVGAVLFSVLLMLLNIATGGRIFGHPWPVPVAGVALVVAGVRRKAWPRSVPWVPVAAAAIVLFVLYLLPILVAGSGVRTGDPPWHLGWTSQLLSGEAVPTGPAPEFSRNAYPWGFHAVLAMLVRLVPGSDALTAHEGVHVVLVIAIPVAAACIARVIDRRAGWGAAAAASLIGGFGWIVARSPDFVLTPTQATFGADLVVASPNSIYEMLPPAYPRELGLVLLAATAVLAVHAARNSARGAAAGAGFVAGLTGLVSLPLFVLGFLWLAAGLAAGPDLRTKVGLWITAAGTSLVTVGVWLVPVAISYVRWGGFLDVTPALGVEWPLVTALGSWGVLLPLALVGAVLVATRYRRDAGARVVIAIAGTTLLFLLVTVARGLLDWSLGNNATLLHQGRVWPAMHLLGAAFAGVVLVATFVRLSARRRSVAVVAIALILGVGAISPVFASIHLTRVMEVYEKGFVYGRADFDGDAFIFRAASELTARDIVRVHGSDFLGFLLFQFSGARLAAYDDPRLEGNELRIRFAELADDWQGRMDEGGFEAHYTALREADAPSDITVVARGAFRDEEWILVNGDLTPP